MHRRKELASNGKFTQKAGYSNRYTFVRSEPSQRIPLTMPHAKNIWKCASSISDHRNFRTYFFRNGPNKSIGIGTNVVVLCSLAISRMVCR